MWHYVMSHLLSELRCPLWDPNFCTILTQGSGLQWPVASATQSRGSLDQRRQVYPMIGCDLCRDQEPRAGLSACQAWTMSSLAVSPPTLDLSCAATATHLSIRMASVRRSFSSQVSLSSAMIFSVSWRARQSTVRTQAVGINRSVGARKRAAEHQSSNSWVHPVL